MLLTLYDSYGNVKARIEPDESSTQDKEIQGDNLLKLSFTLYEFVPVDVNDYVDYGGERYRAAERYVPSEKSSMEWEYSLRLYGIESLVRRFLVLNDADGASEPVFTLTARPVDHVRLIVRNINDGMDGMTNIKAGVVEGTDNVTIDYTGKYCNEALKELAEAVGTEWWLDGETLNLCRCEHGEEVVLGYGKGLTSLERDMADGAKFYTRLFPIGSSRNIDAGRYGHSRLMLPDGTRYVDVNVEKYGIIHHYEQSAFAGIYPRRVGVVSSVRHEQAKDKDGKPFTIWHFKDDDLPFDPNDYEIGGLVKRVSFQEGSELAGLGADNEHYFEVNYDSKTREFEMITIWPYGDDTQLPGGTLVPKPGDKYILWNIRMPDEYYGLAEKEFRSAVDEYNRKHALDVSRYKAPTDHVWIEDTGTDLFIGRRIRLESREYFPETGCRQSRITKITRKVGVPSQMDLEISDSLSTGVMSKIEDGISGVKQYAGNLVGAMNIPDLIRSWDTTKPADTNIYSARRAHQEFLNKNTGGRAKGKVIFEKGADFGESHGIDDAGRARLQSVILEVLQSADFNGLAEDGFGFARRKDGKYQLSITDLIVWGKAVFNELELRKLSYVGGNMVFSACGSKIIRVEMVDSQGSVVDGEEQCASFRCYFHQDDGTTATTNLWAANDQARCQTSNIKPGVYQGVYNRQYWRRVTKAGPDYVDLSRLDCMEGSDIPRKGDTIVQMGNRTDTDRQSMIYLVTVGDDAPAIVWYDGVNGYTLEGKATSVISPKLIEFNTSRFRLVSGDGSRVPFVADRGAWDPSQVYGYYDRVSHGGSLWLCVAPQGKNVREEPSRESIDWQVQVSKGEAGEESLRLILDIVDGSVFYRPGQSHIATIEASIIRGNTDITQEYHPSQIVWTRESEADDTHWNDTHREAGTRINIGTADIAGKTAIVCTIYDKHGETENTEKINL